MSNNITKFFNSLSQYEQKEKMLKSDIYKKIESFVNENNIEVLHKNIKKKIEKGGNFCIKLEGKKINKIKIRIDYGFQNIDNAGDGATEFLKIDNTWKRIGGRNDFLKKGKNVIREDIVENDEITEATKKDANSRKNHVNIKLVEDGITLIGHFYVI